MCKLFRLLTRAIASPSPHQEYGKNEEVIKEAIGMVRAERRIDQEVSRETCSFLLSFSAVQTFASAVRSYRGIENRLHWMLNVTFREEDSRVQLGHTSENLAVLCHISLNL
jgi:predicted transposase YbfD/YdcC